ncbi:MAG: DNA mismatch repair endonuclease MutL [Rickettsiales bacterium]|jgi:DNA mismatch repair protein MutL|nr:DNA mismatch repair endonuclease MutL [Rickettsiales bacterium]
MTIRILPDSLINQIAAGEVVERPASVVKELTENALDAGADQIIIDVADGGRSLISIIDNGKGMGREDLENCIKRHATSKLPEDDLLNINFMGFRGEALPSIASVSDMTIDTKPTAHSPQPTVAGQIDYGLTAMGLMLDCNTGQIKPSPWDSGTRIRVENLFAKTPARLKFLRGDRAEMMSVVEVVKRLAMARPDVGFVLNNKWRFVKNQPLIERIAAVMGDEVRGRMLEINNENHGFRLTGFISEPTLRRASSIDQYLFVNGRPVKDKVLVGALRAAYMDVMHAREFPLAALYLELSPRCVDVNVSPAKTDVHFLEPANVRGFIIKTLRAALAATLQSNEQLAIINEQLYNADTDFLSIRSRANEALDFDYEFSDIKKPDEIANCSLLIDNSLPLGKVVGQIGNKYILSENESGLVIIDQHAAAERITYERLRRHDIKVQSFLTPLVIPLKPEQVIAVSELTEELSACGLTVQEFGEDAVAITAAPADWDLDWAALLRVIADEVAVHGHSSQANEKLHLKLANYACHHSVRAGQKLSAESMDALLRDIERTEHGGECNHGRPVYKFIPFGELDGMFER